jgi:Fe-S-cluster containining protein
MTKKDSIFLTRDEAIDAVCQDFRQYEPQILLFSEVIRVLSKGDMVVTREMGKEGLWINQTGRRNMRWLEGSELIDTLCDILFKNNPDSVLLSAVCARVFQTTAFPAEDPVTGRSGIRVLTGMEGFQCHQCGRCCRTLDYRNEITNEDVSCWERLGRTDILDWVGVFQRDDRETVYRIWMKPGTREFAETCPFLQKLPAENRWICRIHDVKPWICRQYPVSRKHAVMTGCPGFLPKETRRR